MTTKKTQVALRLKLLQEGIHIKGEGADTALDLSELHTGELKFKLSPRTSDFYLTIGEERQLYAVLRARAGLRRNLTRMGVN
jgi:hypothetical protein